MNLTKFYETSKELALGIYQIAVHGSEIKRAYLMSTADAELINHQKRCERVGLDDLVQSSDLAPNPQL